MVKCGRYTCSVAVSDFGLSATTYEDFTRSQWNLPRVVLLLYRLLVVGYFFGYQLYLWISVLTIQSYIYMTDLTYTIFVTYHLIALTNLVTNLIRQEGFNARGASNVMNVGCMIQWLFYNVTITWTCLVLVVYWGALYNPNYPNWFFDITCHLLPGVFSLLELGLISATPFHFVHIIYPFIYGAAYLIFTLIYWATGHDPIYPILDYGGDPGLAAGSIMGMVGFIVVFHALVWGLTKLRQRAAERCNCYTPSCLDNMQTELIDRMQECESPDS